jgi:hypothetical protein
MNIRRLLATLALSCCLLALVAGCKEKGADIPTTREIDKAPKIGLPQGLSDNKK